MNNYSLLALKKTLKDAKSLETDLLEMSEHEGTCPICAQYQGRVFSISGDDKRFPKLPDIVFKTGGLHEGCRHSFFPFLYGISKSTNGHDDIISFSNRPFDEIK